MKTTTRGATRLASPEGATQKKQPSRARQREDRLQILAPTCSRIDRHAGPAALAVLLLAACHRHTPADDSGAVNHAPAVQALISPTAPTAADTLTALSANTDPDGDTLSLTFAWTVDGAPYAALPPTLAGPFPKGTEVQVAVTADDGLATAVDTAFVTIGNTPPGAPTLRIVSTADPENPGVDGLRCEVEADGTDPDGDAVTSHVAWTVDGAAFAGETTSLSGDTVPAADTARGSDWVCTATSSDGEADGPTTTATLHEDGPAPNQYAFEKIVDVPMPSDLAVLPDDTVLVTTLLGDLYRVDVQAGVVLSSLTIGVPDDVLGLTVDPRYGDGDHDWIYTWTAQSCALQRWHVDALDPLTLSEPLDIVTAPCPVDTSGHCGGDVKFHGDVDGQPVLYLVTGPVGSLDESDPDQPPGKLWAMTVTDDGVASPAFASPYGDGWYAAKGFRNPWRIVECGDGLCIPDPGTSTTEEVDWFDPASATSGADFGFPTCEGPCDTPDSAFIEPIFSYDDSDDSTWLDADLDGGDHEGFVNVPVAALRLDAKALGGRLDGQLVMSDVYDGWVVGLALEDQGIASGDPTPLAHLPWLISMEELSDGTVVAAEFGGSLQRMIVRADRAKLGEAGDKLSDTTWAEGGIAYTPLYPLWSNGAGKGRFLQLPAGETIDTSDPDEWVYPEGTKIWKDFDVDGQRAETRLIEKTADGWVPAVYAWDGDNATLTNGFRQEIRLADGSAYTVPSTAICQDCHQGTRGSEWVLGLNALQLGDAGLADFASVLSAPVTAPTISGTAENQYARGYLNANCAMCHNPAGITSSTTVLTLDLRYDTPLDEMGLDGSAYYYHANPNLSDGGAYVDPADPSASVITLAISRGDMPPLLVSDPDADSARSINDWIANLSGY